MKESTHISQAIEKLSRIRGKNLTPEERKKTAIELAADMLSEAILIQTSQEKKHQAQLARMMKDNKGKAFTTFMTDQCFRSHKSSRVASQMIYLLNKLGIPHYLDPLKKIQLAAFQFLGSLFSYLFVPLAIHRLRKETSSVILPGEKKELSLHMEKRRKENVRLNLNHLGEAILGEEEAKRRLQVYLQDLAQDDIEYISVKISTIFSQINLLSWEKTLEELSLRLKELYRAAAKHHFIRFDGTKHPKFVNLDMEEYRDLHLTKILFKKVLEEEEFYKFSAGIVLQAYLPDSHEIQIELTKWAIERVKNGGAPIKIRIVKGANLGMEQFEASVKGWPQAPYKTKIEVDANYKRMVVYGCIPEHARAVHLGIASHNLFDIAYSMLLRTENQVEKEVSFEMLEGMADHIRRVVQKLSKDMLLYCPVATKEDFQSAVAYLIRRLDENTGPDNFLRHTFGLKPHTDQWTAQAFLFSQACTDMNQVGLKARKQQNRSQSKELFPLNSPFENEPDTDFSLLQNRIWALNIIKNWQQRQFELIPLVIDGKEITSKNLEEGIGYDPSYPGKPLYRYTMATWEEIDLCLNTSKDYEKTWQNSSVEERCLLLAKAAQRMREKRGDLIGVMIADGGKSISEGDPEISEAIDFAEYYLRSMLKMDACEDIQWSAKGTVLVTPPWNFPISIPVGGILAALVAGNCVIFKPAPEAVLSGWVLINILWEAGIPKKALQFLNCQDDPFGSRLISDKRLSSVILTGATSTAKLFLKLHPGLDLGAETGGKNAIIVTGISDRDLAIKDLVQSAFGHSGQKCSAASLAILEAEVYDDPHFRKHLADAVQSLTVGSAWDLSSKVIPLIREPNETLLRGLTTLEKGESWLVKPKQHPNNPHLWSPGVKLGVKEGSFMHQTELFGPVLAVMRAKNLAHAVHLANGTPYGLTSGLQSLDEREQNYWIKHIESGNCYINRGITGAIVRRQPFGGCKASSFGHGVKAGGPSYVAQFTRPKQIKLPQEKAPVSQEVNLLTNLIEKFKLSVEELGLWYGSIANYAYWAERMKHDYDPSKVVGQDNLLRYRPRKNICFRIGAKDSPLDILRVLAAAASTQTSLEVSLEKGKCQITVDEEWKSFLYHFHFKEESDDHFLSRVKEGIFERIRIIGIKTKAFEEAASISATTICQGEVLANGRFELLHYVREIAISIDYHRYGNLGLRENEERKPIL